MNTVETRHLGHAEVPAGDYFVVATEWNTFYVSAWTAARVARCLDRAWRPCWLKFSDVGGSRVWVRTAKVEAVYESTELQRARDRRFQRALRQETRADRRWDDDD
ncbi:MAG TPA: hypothetical protein VFE05_14745 [Longimicrobiaceae bacterium]|jgi:hypothetical protein|nr:hypothetical protein [Longimicrobiaceae bacterium]